MFKCELTGKQVGPRVSPVRVVLETRQKKYTNQVDKKIIESTGWEVVKEALVDPEVARKMNTGDADNGKTR